MNDYRLSDLLDLAIVQKMADAHYRASRVPICIVDTRDNATLVEAGCQEICVNFHRTHPKSLQRCLECDSHINDHLIEGEACHHQCRNGLWEIGLPITVSGTHVATLRIGQFFYQGEKPQERFFTQLADQFGFDRAGYFTALEQVPVFTREKLADILEYVKRVVKCIAGLVGERHHLHNQLEQAQKLASIGRLACGVAHDFNNMLGLILGHVEMILMGVGPEFPLISNLEDIQRTAERSTVLARQLLAFSRKAVIAPQALDLNQSMGRLITMLRRLIGEQIELTWMPASDLWKVWIDPSQVDQILINLAVNARDAITGTGNIIIETRNVTADAPYCDRYKGLTPGQYVMLAIGDNGHGMDPGTQSLVFDPFFTTKQPGKGTGLGLTTVYDIIQQNHGIISISSEPAKGTTFTLHLKRFTGTPDPVFQEAPATSPPGGLETVLLVEDDPNFLEMTQRILQGLGYKVLISATGREAVRLAAANAGQIHLLITDVVMPDMNGPDLVQHLMPLYPTMRHLYMSGYSVEMIEQYGIPEAQAHFIEKPFSLNELAAKVREALTSESDLPAQQG